MHAALTIGAWGRTNNTNKMMVSAVIRIDNFLLNCFVKALIMEERMVIFVPERTIICNKPTVLSSKYNSCCIFDCIPKSIPFNKELYGSAKYPLITDVKKEGEIIVQ